MAFFTFKYKWPIFCFRSFYSKFFNSKTFLTGSAMFCVIFSSKLHVHPNKTTKNCLQWPLMNPAFVFCDIFFFVWSQTEKKKFVRLSLLRSSSLSFLTLVTFFALFAWNSCWINENCFWYFVIHTTKIWFIAIYYYFYSFFVFFWKQ